MEQVYVTNLEKMQESIGGQEYELHRIAEWLTVIGEEMRYANAMTRMRINGKGDAKYYAKRLWEYRSNKIGHKHSGPVVYSKNEKALFESMYRMYKSVIDDGMKKFETE